MIEFHGKFRQLKAAVNRCGFSGKWSQLHNGGYVFSAKIGAILNWWPQSGELQFQGAKTKFFGQAISETLHPKICKTSKPSPTNPKIILVSGDDHEVDYETRTMLGRIGLKLFIPENSSGVENSIKEARTQKHWRRSIFGIVLLSADDLSQSTFRKHVDPWAEQDLILETGMLMATLGPKRMVILQKGPLTLPSKIDKIPCFEFVEHPKDVLPQLASRLRAAGFTLDRNKVAAASAQFFAGDLWVRDEI